MNYNFADYLPDGTASTIALDVMKEEYQQAVPNMRVLLYDVTIPEALDYKERIRAVDGVEEVQWLDDAVNIYEPLEMVPAKTIEDWYKDGDALFSVTVDEEKETDVVDAVREIIGDENSMSGDAVTNALAPRNTSKDIQKIMLFVVPLVIAVLMLTTESWFEPVLFMVTIGVAILLNQGTNLIFGTVSFVTNAAGSVLQLAVSMDYSIFLLHRFAEKRQEYENIEDAMTEAVKASVGSILSSGLTTVTGFLALVLMRFKIGPDMGWAMVKAIIFSLVCVLCFLPALTACSYRMIDKCRHKSFIPSFDKFAAVVLKIRIPVLIVFIVLLIPSIAAQKRNDYLYGSSEVYNTTQTQMGRDLIAINESYGASNPVVLMVPKGSIDKETAMNQELKELPYVNSVISYVNNAGASIPVDFLPEETVSQLYSEHYSRFVINLDTAESDAQWYDKVLGVRNIGEKYYGDEIQYAGELASTKDLKTTITADNVKVNALAIGFVVLILLFNFKSVSLPVILTAVIEASIWINMSVPYFKGDSMYYIAYLIISSVQLGATIDYAILFTGRYMEFRQGVNKREAAFQAIRTCTVSIFTSAVILIQAGYLLGRFSTNGVLSQIGTLIGRGAAISFVLVIFVLPTLLMLCDRLIIHTTKNPQFYEGGIENEEIYA